MVFEVTSTELFVALRAWDLDRSLVLVLFYLFFRTMLPVLAHAVSEHVASAHEVLVAATLPAHILGMSVASSLLRFRLSRLSLTDLLTISVYRLACDSVVTWWFCGDSVVTWWF